ncbi:hypothetical protein ASZ90_003488 [hydrocarbon metagenome]|uniref:ABC-three component systems C-terminal domain-containing protein n=1 Tax=hydrocarbon metagenome TaxID=938273 RepID=A0A0W8G0I8_9ZZZZ
MEKSTLRHTTRNKKSILEPQFKELCIKYIQLKFPQAKEITPEMKVPPNSLLFVDNKLFLTLPKLQLKETSNYIKTNAKEIKAKNIDTLVYLASSNLYNNIFVKKYIQSNLPSSKFQIVIEPNEILVRSLLNKNYFSHRDIDPSLDLNTLYDEIYLEEVQQIKIFERIFNYIYQNTSKISTAWKRDLSIIPLKEKIALNFSVNDEADEILEMYDRLWSHILLAQYYVEINFETDNSRLHALLDQVQSIYKQLNHFNKVNTPVNYPSIIDKMAEKLLPSFSMNDAETLACAKSIVLYFFEICEFGRKLPDEQQSLFNNSDSTNDPSS